MAAHHIYAEELTTLKHGHPLWEPDCDPEVSIADVGHVRHGQFCRLFNASLPKGHPDNQECGEPDGYEPLEIGRLQERAPHPPGVLSSRSVSKQGADIGFSGSILEAGAGFHFSCKKDRGAILIINSEAYRKDTLRLGAFKLYLTQHYDSWLRLANNEHNARGISLSDLVFVTGCDNTADWAAATFNKRSLSGGVSFEAGYPTLAGAQFSIWGSWKQTSSMHSHCGPRIPRARLSVTAWEATEDSLKNVCAADLNKYNQCIFLRGFRIMERMTLARRKLSVRAKSGSSGLDEVPRPFFQRSSSSSFSSLSSNKEPSSSDGDSVGRKHSNLPSTSSLDDSDSGDIGVVSDYPEGRAPIEALLEYILEKSDAEVAVAHDDDLADVLQDDDEISDLDALIGAAAIPIYTDRQGVGTVKDHKDHPSAKHDDLGQEKDPTDISTPRIQPDDKDNHVPVPIQLSPEASGQSSPTFSPPATPRAPYLHLLVGKHQMMQAALDPDPTGKLQMTKQDQSSSRTRKPKGPSKSEIYQEELEHIRVEIDVHQTRLAVVQNRISLTTKTGRAADRKNSLRAEMDALLDKQLAQRAARDTTSVELKALQDELKKKLKGVKKLPARTTEEIDAQISTLQSRVETGTMRLAEERAALRQISSLRRSRTTVESSQALQADIDAHRARSDALQKKFNSEFGTTTARLDSVREEIDKLEKESKAAFAERGALYSERSELQTGLTALYERRRQAMERYRAEREEERRKADEERSRLAAEARVERAAQEEQRRVQARERLLEKARAPAFAAEIRDCRSLLEYFSSKDKRDDSMSSTSSLSPTSEAKHHTHRSMDNHPGAGWVPMKRKTEDSYFVGGKGKVKKGHRKDSTSTSTGSAKVSVPLAILSTLVSLSISPPAVASDVPRTVAELRAKIEWFEANQTRVTEENVARTTADLQRISTPMRSYTVF